MKPEIVAAIAEANENEAERAKAASEKSQEPGLWSDAAIQLDTAGQVIDLVVDIGSAVAGGLRATGECVAAVCDAIPSID